MGFETHQHMCVALSASNVDLTPVRGDDLGDVPAASRYWRPPPVRDAAKLGGPSRTFTYERVYSLGLDFDRWNVVLSANRSRQS